MHKKNINIQVERNERWWSEKFFFVNSTSMNVDFFIAVSFSLQIQKADKKKNETFYN